MDVIVSRIVQVIILVPAVVMLAVWAVACIRPVPRPAPWPPRAGPAAPQALQLTGTAAELLALAEGIRDAVHLIEMRQLAESMDPIPGTVTS